MTTYSAEYAKSGRAKCKVCKTTIDAGVLRFGSHSDNGDMQFTAWRHAHCQKKPRSNPSAAEIAGYDDLDEGDQKIVDDILAGKPVKAGGGGGGAKKAAKPKSTKGKKRKRDESDEDEEEEASEEEEKPKKKRAKRAKADEEEEEEAVEAKPKRKRAPSAKAKAALAAEEDDEEEEEEEEDKPKKKPTKKAAPKAAPAKAAKPKAAKKVTAADKAKAQITKAKEEFDAMSMPEMKELLRINNQKVGGKKNELVERCAENKVLGALPKCPKCAGGFLARSGASYTCPGFMEDDQFHYCKASFSAEEIDAQRTPWQTS